MSRTTTTTSLSSLDSESAKDTFESIYQLLTRLKDETTLVRNGLKGCSKKFEDISLGDRFLEPRPHALPWFKKHSLETPCDLEDFMTTLFSDIAARRHICHRTRTLILTREEAILFQVDANTAYRWIEVLSKLPAVFY